MVLLVTLCCFVSAHADTILPSAKTHTPACLSHVYPSPPFLCSKLRVTKGRKKPRYNSKAMFVVVMMLVGEVRTWCCIWKMMMIIVMVDRQKTLLLTYFFSSCETSTRTGIAISDEEAEWVINTCLWKQQRQRRRQQWYGNKGAISRAISKIERCNRVNATYLLN